MLGESNMTKTIEDIKLENQISDLILEVANLYDEVTTSDLQALASVKAQEIIKLLSSTSPAAPQAVELVNTVEVQYWNSRRYSKSEEGSGEVFEMEITDQRKTHGQLYVDVANPNGNVDDQLSAIFEINRLPGSKDDVQCLNLNFDGDNQAAMFFKQGDSYIMRLQNGVKLLATVLPNGEHAFILE